jgi:hypothetical protein
MTGAIPWWKTPTAWAGGRAGLVRGPRKLKTVGTPSSRRGPAVRLSPELNAGAKQNVMPTSSATLTTAAGGRLMTTPSSSSTSAAPAREEAARPPCLTTLTPAAAATMAAMVEMFTVWARSPPVPTRSTGSPETLIAADFRSMPSASPDTSATLSPLARSAIANAAIWASVAVSPMICSMAHLAWSEVRDLPSSSVLSSAGQVVVMVSAPFVSARRGRVRHASGRLVEAAGAYALGGPPRRRATTGTNTRSCVQDSRHGDPHRAAPIYVAGTHASGSGDRLGFGVWRRS